MRHVEKWIWLPEKEYPNEQTTVCSGFLNENANNYTVAEFIKNYVFPQKVVRAELRFSGDTAFQLFCNDRIIATGPACVGGDFLGNETPRDNFYAFETTIYFASATKKCSRLSVLVSSENRKRIFHFLSRRTGIA